MQELDVLIGETFNQLTSKDALARLIEAGTAYGQVRSVREMSEHPALRTWPMRVGDRDLNMIAPPVSAPWDEKRFRPVPALGQHNEQLRAEFGAPTQESTARSEEHTSELQSLMRISYAVFCLQKKKQEKKLH